MGPRTVSPRTFYYATGLLFVVALFLICFPTQILLQDIRGFHKDVGFYVLGAATLLYVPFMRLMERACTRLGVLVRSDVVQRFKVAAQDHGESAEEPPLVIHHRPWLRMFLFAAPTFMFVMIILGVRNPVPGHNLSWPGVCFLVGITLVWFVIALVFDRTIVCEINARGLSAPAAYWSFAKTFVPWDALESCAIIRDEHAGHDLSFVIRDYNGELRFKDAHAWLCQVSAHDRARIFAALRSRFPVKEKTAADTEATSTQAAASSVWDQQLDG